LRSYDRQMPEEINRILTDHCSDYLFAPTAKAKEILLHEGIPERKIFVTGNTIVDAVYANLEIAKELRDVTRHLNLSPKEYFLVTLHRQENVDSETRFSSILKGLDNLATKFDLPVIYPIHPRSRKTMSHFKLVSTNINLIEPSDYLSFLQPESNAKLILTDSGGIQEEACILGIPCVTLRDNTERPETIEVGANILAGTSPDKILECTESMLSRKNNWINPFGDGKVSERIIQILR